MLRPWVRCLLARPASEHEVVLTSTPHLSSTTLVGNEAYACPVYVTSAFLDNLKFVAVPISIPLPIKNLRWGSWAYWNTGFSAGPGAPRAHRTDAGHYFEYSLHEFALLPPAVALGTVAAKKNTSRPALEDGARASCPVGPPPMHCITLGRRRAALKRSQISWLEIRFLRLVSSHL